MSEVFVYTMNRVGSVGAWSRYLFPFEIDYQVQLGTKLYLRSGDSVYLVDKALDHDLVDEDEQPIEAVVWWPWLDMGRVGMDKYLEAMDLVGSGPGTVKVEIGYDQDNPEAFTEVIEIPMDTLVGEKIPIEATAPSFSLRLTFTGRFKLKLANLYLIDRGRQ